MDEAPRWRAWFDNGHVYNSSTTSWEQLPCCGVVAVMVYLDPPNREILSGFEYYCMDAGRIFGAYQDTDARGVVRNGKWVSDEEFERIQREAMEDMRWP